MLVRNVLLLSALLVLFAATAFSQTPTATLSGAIRDASGAVVPGAQISVTSTEFGTRCTTLSDETGRYILTNLPLRLDNGLPAISALRLNGWAQNEVMLSQP